MPFVSNSNKRIKTYWKFKSLINGSNLGPPGIATLSAFAVKNDFKSNK